MKKIIIGGLILSGLLLAADKTQKLQQIENVGEKIFGFKEIKNCNDFTIEKMSELNITTSKQIMGEYSKSENNLYEDLKTGKEIDYIVCKENNMFFLKIKTTNFEIKNKE